MSTAAELTDFEAKAKPAGAYAIAFFHAGTDGTVTSPAYQTLLGGIAKVDIPIGMSSAKEVLDLKGVPHPLEHGEPGVVLYGAEGNETNRWESMGVFIAGVNEYRDELFSAEKDPNAKPKEVSEDGTEER